MDLGIHRYRTESFHELVFTVTPCSPILFCAAIYPINYCFVGERAALLRLRKHINVEAPRLEGAPFSRDAERGLLARHENTV